MMTSRSPMMISTMTEDSQGLSWEEGKTGGPLIFHFILKFCSIFVHILNCDDRLLLAKRRSFLKSHDPNKELRSPSGFRQ